MQALGPKNLYNKAKSYGILHIYSNLKYSKLTIQFKIKLKAISF